MKPTKPKRQKRSKHNEEVAINPPTNGVFNAANKTKELPPNENLKKLPDEAYGDTEIPRKHRNL